MKYDKEIDKKISENIIINYGIVNGNNIIVFVKSGQDGSLYGYENKYIKLAKNINKEYGCTVICSSNPFDGNNPLDDAMEVIEEYAQRFSDYVIYYIGYSNGALIGVWFGTQYKKIKRMLLVNGPLMYNYYKTKTGALNFTGERLTFVYGSLDQSIVYTELLKNIIDDKIKLEIIENEDHHFSKKEQDFFSLPNKYLFYDK